jgi:hypothetical protein
MITAALIAGLITSIHCVGMCGPLACAVCPKKGGRANAWTSLPAYHGGRLISYTLLGALLGWLGKSLTALIPTEIPHLLPWAFILLFLIIFLGWEKKWTLPDWQWLTRLRTLLPSPADGPLAPLFMGLGTPLLPCGPLYLVFGLAVVAGSWTNGALMMAAFALGTIPLLLLLQLGMTRWQQLISPTTLRHLQRGLALIALGVMIWRVTAGDPLSFGEAPCPMCH